MNTPVTIRIESARTEIINIVEMCRKKHGIPPCVMDGILSSVLADVRNETKTELINATDAMVKEVNEELEKAKTAAKRVLKTESESEQKQECSEE